MLGQHTGPGVARAQQSPAMESSDGTEEPPLPLALSRFQVSEEFGFLLPDPLVGAGCASPSSWHSRQAGKERGW